MCLYWSKNATDKFKKNNKNHKFVWCEKMYYYNKHVKVLHTKFFGTERPVRPGVIRSNRGTTRVGIKTDGYVTKHNYTICKDTFCNVRRGIHVYALLYGNTKPRVYMAWNDGMGVYVPVKCYMKDFVGIDETNRQMVFTEVHLSEKDYNEAIRIMKLFVKCCNNS
jgi:hypothetical protein